MRKYIRKKFPSGTVTPEGALGSQLLPSTTLPTAGSNSKPTLRRKSGQHRSLRPLNDRDTTKNEDNSCNEIDSTTPIIGSNHLILPGIQQNNDATASVDDEFDAINQRHEAEVLPGHSPVQTASETAENATNFTKNTDNNSNASMTEESSRKNSKSSMSESTTRESSRKNSKSSVGESTTRESSRKSSKSSVGKSPYRLGTSSIQDKLLDGTKTDALKRRYSDQKTASQASRQSTETDEGVDATSSQAVAALAMSIKESVAPSQTAEPHEPSVAVQGLVVCKDSVSDTNSQHTDDTVEPVGTLLQDSGCSADALPEAPLQSESDKSTHSLRDTQGTAVNNCDATASSPGAGESLNTSSAISPQGCLTIRQATCVLVWCMKLLRSK